MMSAAAMLAATVVIRRLTRPPMMSRRRVSSRSGTSANGMPNDSTTWLSTSASVGFTPIARTTSAGSIVTRRRRTIGIVRCDEALHDDLTGQRADAGGREARGEQREREGERGAGADEGLEPLVRLLDRVDVRQAVRVEQRRGDDEHRHVRQPGEPHRDRDVDALEAQQAALLLGGRRDDPPLGERRVQVDDVRHDRRAEDAGGEQHAVGALEARDEPLRGLAARRSRCAACRRGSPAGRRRASRR